MIIKVFIEDKLWAQQAFLEIISPRKRVGHE